ncbi:biotin-dependent carboxyltransferase family protein [Ornithinibacillus xuwenensis]|uniref:Biotin-dependent carboxyltransferase family protein n=1 Tax=Ornithinibacillus xuwenensis TaxID=3144668 RepID=A0ABU9XKB6_9BACI
MKTREIFRVIKPGLLTTIQDMGRIGYQRYGVPVSGAMDTYAFQLANILVGNPRGEACLEVTLTGPELEAKTSITIAITGANIEPMVNGKRKPMWTSFRMKTGDRLRFGKYQAGVFAYIAIAGGFSSPSFFDSRSTDIQSGLGKALEANAHLRGNPMEGKHGISMNNYLIPTYQKKAEVAVIEGPHTESIPSAYRSMFFEKEFTLQANSNRMGYRLQAEDLSLEEIDSIWSDAVPFGGVQILPNGQPIILMADRQTTGGYPRIGTIIATDIPKVAQLVPSSKISFYPVSIEEAQSRYNRREMLLTNLSTFRNNIK